MLAIVLEKFGGLNSLVYKDIPEPEPKAGHVVIEAFGINYAEMHSRSTRGRIVSYCLFTDPLLARVGLNEIEAQRQGIAVRVARLPIAAVLRTEATDETKGFMKALVGAATVSSALQ
jgi:pyruvate/2-oxoglutarate dehydrogenase complex dihydrolipoamide dehydrogenase (E3) component